MGLVLLTAFTAIIGGSICWLVLGDRFPFGDEQKWPTVHNVGAYSLLLAIPIYLFIFAVS